MQAVIDAEAAHAAQAAAAPDPPEINTDSDGEEMDAEQLTEMATGLLNKFYNVFQDTVRASDFQDHKGFKELEKIDNQFVLYGRFRSPTARLGDPNLKYIGKKTHVPRLFRQAYPGRKVTYIRSREDVVKFFDIWRAN